MPDAYTSGLLHFNGENGSTTFTDESAKTWTRSGTTTISTSEKKFGSASGLFAGDGGIYAANDADFEFADGDFTVDFWMRPTSGGQSSGSAIIMRADSASAWATIPFGISFPSTGSYAVKFYASSGGASCNLANAVTVGLSVQNTWSHVAIIRYGTVIYCFLDGVLGSATLVGTASLTASNKAFWVGSGNISNCHFVGNIDELRISKGIARWSPYLTLPTTEYDTEDTLVLPLFQLTI
jgi:hypothetical protein